MNMRAGAETACEISEMKLIRQRMPDVVFERLMDWIMDGKVHMGQRLNTEELAQELGVSRMPVREAIKMLEKMGLVESIPYVGARLVELDNDSVRELYILRQALEPVAAYYACQKITGVQLAEVEGFHRDLSRIMKQNDVNAKQIYITNRSFHFAIYNSCGLNRLCEMIDMLWSNLAFYKLIYGRTYIRDSAAATRMLHEHQSYIDALRARDGDRFKDLLSKSLEARTKDVPYQVSTLLSEDEQKNQK